MTNHTQYKTNDWWQLVKFKPKKKKKKKRDLHTMCDKPERKAFNVQAFFSLFLDVDNHYLKNIILHKKKITKSFKFLMDFYF